jgi:hypothetical protein
MQQDGRNAAKVGRQEKAYTQADRLAGRQADRMSGSQLGRYEGRQTVRKHVPRQTGMHPTRQACRKAGRLNARQLES